MSLEIGSADTHGAWLRPASGFPTCGKDRDAAPARTEPNSKAEAPQRTDIISLGEPAHFSGRARGKKLALSWLYCAISPTRLNRANRVLKPYQAVLQASKTTSISWFW